MDVLVINGSPRKERMHTGTLVSLFSEGMKEKGANVDIIYPIELEIGDCRGCLNCWGNTPGKCIQNDDMEEVLRKMANADLLVFASPVYVDGMTGSLKTLIDRTIPLLHGAFVIRDDHCRHTPRDFVKLGKVVLLSVSGFPEMDNFDPLVSHIKAICKNMNREYAGAVLRSIAWSMQGAKEQGVEVDDIFEAVKDAGREIISTGSIKKETLATIAREYMPRDIALQLMTGFYGSK
ncbi:MAG: flavodoxin family protein [Candidatus Thorarchaeota archaeon]